MTGLVEQFPYFLNFPILTLHFVKEFLAKCKKVMRDGFAASDIANDSQDLFLLTFKLHSDFLTAHILHSHVTRRVFKNRKIEGSQHSIILFQDVEVMSIPNEGK